MGQVVTVEEAFQELRNEGWMLQYRHLAPEQKLEFQKMFDEASAADDKSLLDFIGDSERVVILTKPEHITSVERRFAQLGMPFKRYAASRFILAYSPEKIMGIKPGTKCVVSKRYVGGMFFNGPTGRRIMELCYAYKFDIFREKYL